MSWGDRMQDDATVRAPGGSQKPAIKSDAQLIWERLKALFPDQVTVKEDGECKIEPQIAGLKQEGRTWVIFTDPRFSRQNFTKPDEPARQPAGLRFVEKDEGDVENKAIGFAGAKGDFYKEILGRYRFDESALKQGLGIGGAAQTVS